MKPNFQPTKTVKPASRSDGLGWHYETYGMGNNTTHTPARIEIPVSWSDEALDGTMRHMEWEITQYVHQL